MSNTMDQLKAAELAVKRAKRDKEVELVVFRLDDLFNAVKHPTASVRVSHGWEGCDEYIYVHINKAVYTVNITADSKMAIVKDVVDKVIYKF